MNRLVIGIDNGLSGAIVVLAPSNLDVLYKTFMPLKGKKDREVCVNGLDAFFAEIHFAELPLIAIEECPHHASQMSTMRSMAFTCGKLISYLEKRFPGAQIVRVAPGNSKSNGWQYAMLGAKIPRGQTKQYALEASKKFWPVETWSGATKAEREGMIDAALIALFVMRKLKL